MNWWQLLLFPFAILYDLVTRFRNHLYNIGYKKSFEFEANVIAVGNLSVGGTGKTPMVSYLIEHFLRRGKTVATLSRGYGRKTKGFRICGEHDDPSTVGDEPFTYYETFGDQIMVTVGEDRALAIPFILAEKPDLDVILLDDAFQHRSVKPSFNTLLTTSQRPFWKDYVLPSGLLREARSGALRADAIVVTKSNRLEKYEALETLGRPYFQTRVRYIEPAFFSGHQKPIKKVVALAGLANNTPFFDHVNDQYEVLATYSFKDHHHYMAKEVKEVISSIGDAVLLTTHKDAVKLKAFSDLEGVSCAFIPINVEFLEEEERFLNMVDESLKDYSINS